MEQGEKNLSGIELFGDLSARDHEALGKRCRWHHYDPHQQIIAHQDASTDVFFIVSGKVRAVIYSQAGKEVTFSDMGAGNAFGEISAIDGKPRSVNVIALSDTVVATMPADDFIRVLHDHPEVSIKILKQLAGMVRTLSDRVFESSALSVKNRIHAELLRLARDHVREDNSAVISPAPTHADIASRVGIQRETVTRALNELGRDGLIARRGGTLVINDFSGFAGLADQVFDP